jgi:hypothetical protein
MIRFGNCSCQTPTSFVANVAVDTDADGNYYTDSPLLEGGQWYVDITDFPTSTHDYIARVDVFVWDEITPQMAFVNTVGGGFAIWKNVGEFVATIIEGTGTDIRNKTGSQFANISTWSFPRPSDGKPRLFFFRLTVHDPTFNFQDITGPGMGGHKLSPC